MFLTGTHSKIEHARQYICGLLQAERPNMERMLERVGPRELEKLAYRNVWITDLKPNKRNAMALATALIDPRAGPDPGTIQIRLPDPPMVYRLE